MMRYLLLLAVATAAHGQYGAATSIVSGNGAPVAAQCTNANNVGRVWARKNGGAASSTFYVCAATGAGTYGWQLNDGAIGGAGNIASGQVLYGTAAGVAGSEANLFWDAANDRLGINTASPTWALTVSNTFTANPFFINPGIGAGVVDTGTSLNSAYTFYVNSVERARFAAATGNLLLGTTTDDGSNRLQVAGSGSFSQVSTDTTLTIARTTTNTSSVALVAGVNTPILRFSGSSPFNIGDTSGNGFFYVATDGTVTVRNPIATTGATQLIVRAGAGQSSTNLQTWQSAAGTALAAILPTGQYRFIGVTVASLPAAAAGNAGATATVTDATVTTIGTTVAGGGANTVLVWSNGTNWRIYAN